MERFGPSIPGSSCPYCLRRDLRASAALLCCRAIPSGSADSPLAVVAFIAGWLTLVAALVSPLHWLGEHLFTLSHDRARDLDGHIRAVAGVGAAGRNAAVVAAAPRIGCRSAAAMRLPVLDALLAMAAARAQRDARARRRDLGLACAAAVRCRRDQCRRCIALQHLSFFLTAILFWWSVLRRSETGAAAWHLFVTMLHTSVLGALDGACAALLYQAQTGDCGGVGADAAGGPAAGRHHHVGAGRNDLCRRGPGPDCALDHGVPANKRSGPMPFTLSRYAMAWSSRPAHCLRWPLQVASPRCYRKQTENARSRHDRRAIQPRAALHPPLWLRRMSYHFRHSRRRRPGRKLPRRSPSTRLYRWRRDQLARQSHALDRVAAGLLAADGDAGHGDHAKRRRAMSRPISMRSDGSGMRRRPRRQRLHIDGDRLAIAFRQHRGVRDDIGHRRSDAAMVRAYCRSATSPPLLPPTSRRCAPA